MYHYRASGLDNIYLQNGYRTINYGGEKAVAVENSEQLHRSIAQALIQKTARLSGQEFRFLRIEMDLSQNQLGRLLDVSEQSVAAWEKSVTQKIPGPAERLMRLYASERLLRSRGQIGALLQRLAGPDDTLPERMYFVERDAGWERAEAALSDC